MPFAALQRAAASMIVDAPATADMPLDMACCAMAHADPSIVWDKNILDGYEGEKGLSVGMRFLTIIGAILGTWTVTVGIAAGVIVAVSTGVSTIAH